MPASPGAGNRGTFSGLEKKTTAFSNRCSGEAISDVEVASLPFVARASHGETLDHFPLFTQCGKMGQAFRRLEERKMSHAQVVCTIKSALIHLEAERDALLDLLKEVV